MSAQHSLYDSSEDHLLVREFTHRIANEYSSAIASISLMADKAVNSEVKTALDSIICQLHGFALVNRALQRPNAGVARADTYLRTLCCSVGRSMLQKRGINLILAADEIRLPSDRVWRLGLIVFELITNAARHAFPRPGGSIYIRLTRTTSFVECRVSDNGCAPQEVRSGRGSRIIGSLVQSLQGEILRQFTDYGSTIIILFPTD
jgi:two-component sensor histidine kinase